MAYRAADERALRLDVLLSSLRLLEQDVVLIPQDCLTREPLLSQIRGLIDALEKERAVFSD